MQESGWYREHSFVPLQGWSFFNVSGNESKKESMMKDQLEKIKQEHQEIVARKKQEGATF